MNAAGPTAMPAGGALQPGEKSSAPTHLGRWDSSRIRRSESEVGVGFERRGGSVWPPVRAASSSGRGALQLLFEVLLAECQRLNSRVALLRVPLDSLDHPVEPPAVEIRRVRVKDRIDPFKSRNRRIPLRWRFCTSRLGLWVGLLCAHAKSIASVLDDRFTSKRRRRFFFGVYHRSHNQQNRDGHGHQQAKNTDLGLGPQPGDGFVSTQLEVFVYLASSLVEPQFVVNSTKASRYPPSGCGRGSFTHIGCDHAQNEQERQKYDQTEI